jgi:hypothetical protein
MNGANPNEAVEMASQIKQIVAQGDVPLNKLDELSELVNQQLTCYEKAVEMLRGVDP